VDATAEKIAKLKETAAEVVAEVSTISFIGLVSTWKIPGVKIAILYGIVNFGCPDWIFLFFYASWVQRTI
jgi:hypothetical protein